MTDAVVRKRARSPSPIYADTLAASPLDVLLKRRRRSEWVPSTSTYSGFAPPPPPVEESGTHHGSHDTDNSSQAAASSPLRRQRDEDEEDGWARRGVSRRRTRQWERLQDPTSVASAPNSVQHTMYAQQSYSQQHLPNPYPPQVTPDRVNNMSSSPVRHQPPSSTPFRADEWTEDERLQEWGDHYAAQNGLLHSLVRFTVCLSADVSTELGWKRSRSQTISCEPRLSSERPLRTSLRTVHFHWHIDTSAHRWIHPALRRQSTPPRLCHSVRSTPQLGLRLRPCITHMKQTSCERDTRRPIGSSLH